MAVDAAEVQLEAGLRYRVGLFDGVDGFVFHYPGWVRNQQVAELYGAWILLRRAARAKYSQCEMLHDNMQAIWNVINLRSRAGLWRQNRFLRAIAHQLRRSGVVVHTGYVPTDLQPADPVSRASDTAGEGLHLAVKTTRARWSSVVNELHQLESKGLSYVAV